MDRFSVPGGTIEKGVIESRGAGSIVSVGDVGIAGCIQLDGGEVSAAGQRVDGGECPSGYSSFTSLTVNCVITPESYRKIS